MLRSQGRILLDGMWLQKTEGKLRRNLPACGEGPEGHGEIIANIVIIAIIVIIVIIALRKEGRMMGPSWT